MKLLAFGLTLLAIGFGFVLFTDLNPATPFIGGVLCTFLGLINAVSPGAGSGELIDVDTITLGRSLSDGGGP